VHGFRGVHEDTREAEAVKRRDELVADLAALAHSANDHFAAVTDGLRDQLDALGEGDLGGPVGAVEVFEVEEGAGFGGENVEPCGQDGLRVVVDFAGRRWRALGSGELVELLLGIGRGGFEEHGCGEEKRCVGEGGMARVITNMRRRKARQDKTRPDKTRQYRQRRDELRKEEKMNDSTLDGVHVEMQSAGARHDSD